MRRITASLLPEPFQRLLGAACVLAGTVHLVFLALFHQADVPVMVMLNVASVLAYLLAALLLHRGRITAAMLLLGTEVVVHALSAVLVTGWSTGFHLYLLLCLPIVLVSHLRSWRLKATLSLTVALLYLGMALMLRTRAPQVVLDDGLVSLIHLLNLAITLLVLGGLTALHVLEIEKAHQRLSDMATTDPLTGLLNRRSLLEAMQREMARHRREHRPLAFLLGDIDHFKQINDQFGHAVGDRVLREVARTLKAQTREIDYLCRWGGEEFLIVLPGTHQEGALCVAERLLSGVSQTRVPASQQPGHMPTPMPPFTLTLGVAVMHDGETLEQVLQRADDALYRGKHAGRNRVDLAA